MSDLSDLIENFSYSSMQSKGVNQSDIPIPSDATSEFQYNYFVPDETTSRTVVVKGDSLTSFTTLSNDSSETDRLIALVEYDVPRFNRISWTPQVLESTITDEGVVAMSDIGVTIADNIANVLYEEVMTSNQYSGIGIQDALSSYQSMGDMSFSSQTDEREAVINDSFSNTATTFDMSVSISNVLAGICGHAWTQDGGSTFFEEFSSIKDLLSEISTKAISDNTAGAISDSDYDISGTPATYRLSENIADQTSGDSYIAQVAGYIIEKHEVDSDGNVFVLDPIIVENPDAGEVIDPNILFGRGYRYRVRTVAYLEFSAINVYPGNESRNETMIVGMFVASRASASTTAICTERIPPKPPEEIEFIYNGKNKSLDISWVFPLNKQRDIKQFRVFRRSSIQSPFELVKNYFFDDSTTLSKTTEIPDPDSLVGSSAAKLSGALIQVVSSPTLLFSDKDFDINSKYIYALTSVDARGMSSNYSSQFEVSYDKFKSRIIVDYISTSGAPMPYPNMYLRRDLFVDTIKTSGFNQMTVYFDPEYLSVINSDESELNILSNSDDEPSYKLSMINLDNQRSKMIDIFVRDRREDSLFEIGEGIEYTASTKVSTLIDV